MAAASFVDVILLKSIGEPGTFRFAPNAAFVALHARGAFAGRNGRDQSSTSCRPLTTG